MKLTRNQRSKGKDRNQKRFRQVLLNIRIGDCTEDYWNLLLTRTPDMNKNIISHEEYVRLSFSNENVVSDNYKAPQSLDVPIPQVTTSSQIT